MTEYPEIYVIRHGQTTWNVQGRFQGRMDSPLTDQGRTQARAIGCKLATKLEEFPARFAAFASPQGRVQASAKLILAPLAMAPKSDPRLQEIGFGAWEGLTFDDIVTGWPERALLAETEPFLWHFQSPGGETLADMSERCQAFLDDLTGPSIVITHGVTSRVLRGLWLGLDEYGMTDLPAGQGVIYHMIQGEMRVIDAGG